VVIPLRGGLAIFDMDGVIVDSMPILTENAISLIQAYFEVDYKQAEKAYLSSVGRPFSFQLKEAFPGHPNLERAIDSYETLHEQRAHSFPVGRNTQYLLEILKRQHYKTALVSSTRRELIQRHMPQVMALPFDFIEGQKDGFNKRDQVEYVIAEAAIPESLVWMFGDTHHDERVAFFAGINFRMISHPTSLYLEVSSALELDFYDK